MGTFSSLGYQGESGVTLLTFDITDWVSEYGDGDIVIYHKRSGDTEAYEVANVECEDGIVAWTVDSTDTASAGISRYQLQYTTDEVVKKSEVCRAYTMGSLGT